MWTLILALGCVAPEPKDPVADSGRDTGAPQDTGHADSGGPDSAADTAHTGDTAVIDTGAPDTGHTGDTAVADSGDSAPDTASDSGSDTATDTGTMGDTGISALAVADFSLPDLNPTSSRYGELVSPRDYLEQTSGWYFTHAT